MKHTFTLVLTALLGLSIGAQARTWTEASTGKEIQADFVAAAGGKVQLKLADGRTVAVDIDRLSQEDQEFINAQSATVGIAGNANWPAWRGADQENISPDTGLLKEWPEGGPEKLWTYEDAGLGYSSFSIVDGTLYTMGTRGGELYTIAINTEDGSEVWSTQFGEDEGEGYSSKWGAGPRGTPTYSDGYVYALGPNGELACLSADDGKEVWSANLEKDFSGNSGGWGYSASPLADGDKLIVAPGGDTDSIVALDKKTGDKIWGADIDGAGKAEYATIVAAEINGQPQYIKLFQTLLVAVDPENGNELWRSEWPRGRTAVIPTPIVSDDKVYITSGYGAGSKLVQISGGEATDVWDNTEMKNHHGGVVKVGDYLYGFSDGAGLICQSWETGKIVWNERGQYISKGSVHVADGMLYCLNEGDGAVTLAEVSPEDFSAHGQFILEPQSPNRSPSGKIWTHPVVLNGKLYLRDQEYISCYDVKKD